jgi:chorismate mutase
MALDIIRKGIDSLDKSITARENERISYGQYCAKFEADVEKY